MMENLSVNKNRNGVELSLNWIIFRNKGTPPPLSEDASKETGMAKMLLTEMVMLSRGMEEGLQRKRMVTIITEIVFIVVLQDILDYGKGAGTVLARVITSTGKKWKLIQ